MKVKALTNIKCGDGWHYAGEVFELPDDAPGEMLNLLVEKAEESASPQAPDMNLLGDEHIAKEEKPKRASARKRN